ncbi:uncharacterized protein BJ171DRAFT_544224 [Polychytrium aggregatum]|uniref:uncharacterized protein n=1 Tax=Polychytrium aggregatum TaxID=110093 RepID=UPI0022FEB48A|nr:uncharacterized protein BJ171DRAFT_544224 [Polychytrium aggregatum]KAI9190578.1 hypothetical protein BJ171DRAFT_544224 [Polychytrium aggregatum]
MLRTGVGYRDRIYCAIVKALVLFLWTTASILHKCEHEHDIHAGVQSVLRLVSEGILCHNFRDCCLAICCQ